MALTMDRQAMKEAWPQILEYLLETDEVPEESFKMFSKNLKLGLTEVRKKFVVKQILSQRHYYVSYTILYRLQGWAGTLDKLTLELGKTITEVTFYDNEGEYVVEFQKFMVTAPSNTPQQN